VNISQLQPTLHDLLADDPKKLVILQGDQSVLLGEAVRIMDIAKRAGAQAISIAAQKESAPAAASSGP
jgi:biopolymer transport protein ExbD